MSKRRKDTHKWVQEQVEVDYDATPIQDVVERLQEKASRLEDAVVRVLPDDEYTGSVFVQGWREMTAAEKAKYQRQAAQAKAAAEKRKAKQRERAEREYERLRKALGKDD